MSNQRIESYVILKFYIESPKSIMSDRAAKLRQLMREKAGGLQNGMTKKEKYKVA